jgi:hypothetical protein
MENNEKIVKFIADNKLDLAIGAGSGLNSACVILAGYALYLGIDDIDTLNEYVEESLEGPTSYDYDEEMNKVFQFAYENNYGAWWKTPQAKKMYKF